MLIFFGTRGTERPALVIGNSCPACKEEGMYIVPVMRYFHIMWIPFFPTAMYYVPVCPHCKGSFPEDTFELSPEAKKEIKYPKWVWAGLFIVGGIFIFGNIARLFN